MKTKLKSSRSLSKLWKGYSLKFSDCIMPVRQSHKEINRDLPQKQIIRSKHLINHQRVKIDISKPNITNIDGKAKKSCREIKAKKFSLPVNCINQALSKTKLIKLDINSKELKVIDSSKERVCETSNSSIERPKNFKECLSLTSILKSKDSNIKHRVKEPKILTDSVEIIPYYDSRTSKNSDLVKKLASYQKPTLSSNRKASKTKIPHSNRNKENKKTIPRNLVKEFNSVRNSGVLLTNVQNNQSTIQYRSFAETQKLNQSTINMKQCKSTLSLLEKYSSSIEKTNKLNTYCKDEFKKYQQRTKQSKVWSSHVKSSVVVPSQVKITNPKPTQFYELKHPNVLRGELIFENRLLLFYICKF